MPKMKPEQMQKVRVTAPLHAETASLKEVAQALNLPAESARQPDLQYLTAIFVSSGMNKNGAVFLGSELVSARNTIADKAVDIEHDEQAIIGQITSHAFLNRDGTLFDAENASTGMSIADMDGTEMDIAISAIIHKARFPELATEIHEGLWMVSMETYYSDYDIKVGDNIIPRDQAEQLGYDKLVGSVVQLKKGDQELGFHLVGRVLRGLLFAGVGIVKNPANERSVILETAALNEYIQENASDASVINLADIEALEAEEMTVVVDLEPEVANSFAAKKDELVEAISQSIAEQLDGLPDKVAKKINKEDSGLGLSQLGVPGTCVNYKRYLVDMPGPDSDTLPEPSEDLTQYPLTTQPGTDAYPPGTRVVAEHYCNLFDLDCSARPGDATLPECWRNVFARTFTDEIISHTDLLRRKRLQEGLVGLQELIDDARKFNRPIYPRLGTQGKGLGFRYSQKRR